MQYTFNYRLFLTHRTKVAANEFLSFVLKIKIYTLAISFFFCSRALTFTKHKTFVNTLNIAKANIAELQLFCGTKQKIKLQRELKSGTAKRPLCIICKNGWRFICYTYTFHSVHGALASFCYC